MTTTESTRATYGAGSLTETEKGSGVWRYRYRVDGVQLRKTFGSKLAPLTRKQAERAVRNMEPAPPAPAAPVDGRTFGSVLTEWLAYGRTLRGAQWAPGTADNNRKVVTSRIDPALGAIPVAALTARDLETVYAKWTAEGLTDNTVHKYAALISSALTFAVRRDYIDHSPSAKAVAPAATKSTKHIPDAVEVMKLFAAATVVGKDMPAAIALAALTGARSGEICAIRWCDVDLKRGTVRIDKSACNVGGVVSIKGTKTGDERFARVEGSNLVMLQSVLGTRGKPDEYVIGGKTEPLNPNTITDRFVSVRGAAHIRNISFHCLRKYFANTLSDAGVPATAIIGIVGWKSTRMLDVYIGATKHGFDSAAAVELMPAQ